MKKREDTPRYSNLQNFWRSDISPDLNVGMVQGNNTVDDQLCPRKPLDREGWLIREVDECSEGIASVLEADTHLIDS